MKTRDIVLVSILCCVAAAVLFAAAAYLFIRRRKKKREDEEDGTSCAIRADTSSSDGGREKGTSRLNGFLSLKTPLISTKTLGNCSQQVISTTSTSLKGPAFGSMYPCKPFKGPGKACESQRDTRDETTHDFV